MMNEKNDKDNASQSETLSKKSSADEVNGLGGAVGHVAFVVVDCRSCSP